MIDTGSRARMMREMGLVDWQLRGTHADGGTVVAASTTTLPARAAVAASAAPRLLAAAAGAWLFIAEAAESADPGHPFGQVATRLFDNMLTAAGLERGETAPLGTASGALASLIARQSPAVLVLLGPAAALAVLGSELGVARLRGSRHSMSAGASTLPVVVSHHPTHLLRHLADKADAWADLMLAAEAATS
jgi:DNA polymerase